MANRKHPVLTALRVTEPERAMIDAAAANEGLSVSRFLRAVVLPAVGQKVAASAARLGEDCESRQPAA